MNNYKVMRRHSGDKEYFPGDTRTADKNDVQHLVPNTLQLVEDDTKNTDASGIAGKEKPPADNKAKPAADNKAKLIADQNKAAE